MLRTRSVLAKRLQTMSNEGLPGLNWAHLSHYWLESDAHAIRDRLIFLTLLPPEVSFFSLRSASEFFLAFTLGGSSSL